MIIEKTVKLIKQFYKIHENSPPKVTSVVVGLGYTGVEVSIHDLKPFVGLASTLPSIITTTDCSKIEFAGNLSEIPLSKLLQWSCEPPSLKKIIGFATVNAVSQHILSIKNQYRRLIGEYFEYLDIDTDTRITIIGLMKPLIRKLSKLTNQITLVEDTNTVSSEFNKFNFKTDIDHLQKEELTTDVLFCTGTVLINNTIEEILKLFRNKARKIIVIGPSVGIVPDVLFDNGVNVVCGMEILNSEATLRVLQEGGGTKSFKQYGKKYNLIKE